MKTFKFGEWVFEVGKKSIVARNTTWKEYVYEFVGKSHGWINVLEKHDSDIYVGLSIEGKKLSGVNYCKSCGAEIKKCKDGC